MFFLYHHHDLDRLAELMAALLSHRSRPHALAPDTVIVPNHGVGRWLQMRLAEHERVAANLHMPLLARFIWDTLPGLLPGEPDSTAFARERLRWHLYAVLPEVARSNQAVAGYLAGEPHDLLRLQLADRLADVFDQYLIYRHGMLADWEAGRWPEREPNRWQAEVWRTLVGRLGDRHRARLLDRAIDALSAGDSASIREALPEAVYCFGLGHLPPEYVRFLYALGQRVDVHFLLPNPSRGYWGDIRSRRVRLHEAPTDEPAPEEAAIEDGHPLLASLGKGTRDLLRVLYSADLTAIHEPELGEALAYEPPPGDTLLERVQADIIRMEAPRNDRGMDDRDASVQIHACHGPLREVQVLQDQLLDLLSRDPDLAPRDIVVMMPDVATYAPAIHSVFGAADRERHLPFSVSDRARAASHPLCQSFLRLLELPLSRWAAGEVFTLTEVPAVMRRFGLDEPSLQTVQAWARAAGVRWGFDAGTRERFGAGALAQNTWRFGLDRLLLGLAQSDEDSLTAGVAPWSDLEGGATAALGSLWYLLERLRHWSEQLQSPATADDWQDRLNALIEELFDTHPDDRPEQSALAEVHGAIAALGEAAQCLGEDEKLSLEVVREILSGEMARPGERQPFLSGGITFCGLVPLRAVPFRVVCLLGMNDSDFPRQESNRSFNVLHANPRLGDHSMRDDDRLLFLQALTAARDVFYISYTGQDVNGGETLPPSPLVGEWLDFLHGHYFTSYTREAFEARLVTHQPMHPFSAHYFAPREQGERSRLFTFAREWQPASRAAGLERIEAPPFVDGSRAEAPSIELIELQTLRRFFDHPPRHFLYGRLQVALEAMEDRAEDAEPLQLDGLDAYMLRRDLLVDGQRAGQSWVDTEPDALWRARGLLPPPPLDAGPFEAQAQQVNALLPVWHDWTESGDSPVHLDVDLTINDRRLVGRIADVWPDGPRLLRPGGLGMKYRLRAWINYLAYRAAGHEGRLRLVGLGKTGKREVYTAHIQADTAQDRLAELMDIFLQGQRMPLPFMPGLAEKYLRDFDKLQDTDQAMARIRRSLTDEFHPAPEASDPYFMPLLQGRPLLAAHPDTPAFEALAERICRPVLEHLTESGDAA